ncbi:LysR family transcriptional regulator [Salinicoccus sp. HZC-1]|uniref:LysR family transcriptional regulator n=1 Tax=Salinicoccus sp. HZC-1 TaxID=3385497 RepID=UPI00398B6478
MNIENLEAFVFVNHFGSINKASKALFLSQPSVTSRIKSLERELDTALFVRTGKKLILNDKGAEFLPYAENIVNTLKKGRGRLEDGKSENQLVIGSSGLISFYLIPRILPLIKQQLPDLNVKVITAPSEEVSRLVSSGEVDLGFASNVSDPKLNSIRVVESPIRLIVPEGHEFVRGKVDTEKLAENTIVFFACGSLDWTMVHNLFLNLKEQPDIKYEVDSMESAKGIILNKAAIGFLPELSVHWELADGSLHALDIPDLANVSLKTDMIYRSDMKLSYINELLGMITEAAGGRPNMKPHIEVLYK